MSWIKENKFLVALGGCTLVGAVLLAFAGFKGADRYAEAKEQYETAANEAAGYERLSLYPRTENRDGKRKALDEYRQSLETFQSEFQRFRPEDITNISPQEFTTRLLAANAEVRKAMESAGVSIPESFFLGFERYRTSLASANTTGILDYQLGVIKDIMLELAKARPSQFRNLHRRVLPEEEGQTYQPGDFEVARPIPLEVTFTGTERSAREFISSITAPAKHYIVIRSLRISNVKKDPPRASDAKFDKATAAPAAAPGGFANVFVFPADESEPDAAVPAGTEGEQAPTPAASPADSSRILAQVLGDEEVHVFLRLDILQFLPTKKLP